MAKPSSLFAGLLLPLFSPATSEAQTVVQMDFAGIFNGTAGSGHPDIAIGDTFSFSITFDGSQVAGEGGNLMNVSSILSAEFRVNRLPHPFLTPSSVGIWVDTARSRGYLQMIPASGAHAVNRVYLNSFSLPFPLPAAEFSDFFAINGVDLTNSDFVVSGANPGDVVRGPLTSLSFTVVPEPSAALLGLSAAAGMLPRRRRRAARPSPWE